ncbi:NADPH:quinone reductase [Adhaeretor mobilis]|uniref:Zinc-type alcohol dehydrogenase-like protein n=1 Tax=Adhaeretor mobilis TaxID=1930276 RepID=A0A517N1U6_9BACT|nr:NADPH:quinone reductase [Adhaeretor mobilis]QDT01095.1 Zinc-type alcohol dehydrogenase-like protein [Adhaeretor mobilis]
MRAAYIEQTGPASNIKVGELPDPTLTANQVLVRVKVAALNPVDTYIRAGHVPFELPMPFVVGCDLAGVVEAVGDDVTKFEPGDRVWGSNQGLLGRQGTFAELAAVDEQWLYPTPEGVTDEAAAATALVGITAHLGLVEEARIQEGETVLVSGGSGGVGSTVVQMAKAHGNRVVATTSNQAKVEYCQRLGADLVINYRTENVAERVREELPDGVNVWWETARTPNFEPAFASLTLGGRMVIMAGRDARPEFPVGPFYSNCNKLLGFVMFLASAKAQANAADDINRWLTDGVLKTRVDRIATLEDTAELHALQESSTIDAEDKVTGKLLVRM